MKLNEKMRKDILKILYNKGESLEMDELETELIEIYGYEKSNIRGKMLHCLDVLEDENKIKKESKDLLWGISTAYISLLSEGYLVFDSWRNFWLFLKNDFSVMLSIIATILSIVAVIISLLK